jgi:phosphoglycolate phosphatase
MPRAILFDLDGTLVDTRAASWELFAETNRKFGLGVDTREAFFRIFEGNFFESLARLCADAAQAEAAKRHFMDLLRSRYQPALIPGMTDVVRALAPHCTLAVLSTNGIDIIRRILVEAGIATCFSHVFSGDVQPKKAASMRRFLGDQRYAAQRCCSPAYREEPVSAAALESTDVVLVTDTAGDVAEAKEVGIRAVGVAWGMHTERQLLEAGAERVALWPQELVAWLRPEGCDAGQGCECEVGDRAAGTACEVPVARRHDPVPERVAVSTPEPVVGLAHAAGRLRREQQLQQRRAHGPACAASIHSGARPASHSDGAADLELLRALRRIVGRVA